MILLLIASPFEGSYGAGQWKDFTSLKTLLEKMGKSYEIIYFDPSRLDEILERCNKEVTDLVVYYSFWPELLQTVRKHAPWIRRHLRTVNAEALQHWVRAEIGWEPSYHNLRNIYGFFRLAWRDTSCRIYADTLLGISAWDDRYYWKRLPGRAGIRYLPYVSPWPALRRDSKPQDWSMRDKVVVCMAGGRDPIGKDMVSRFYDFARAIKQNAGFEEWRFVATGGVHGAGKTDEKLSWVDFIDDLHEPWDYLCRVKAVAILTPLGYGMKTTVVDGITAGCNVLVHQGLARRLPNNLRSGCVVVNPDSHRSMAKAMERISQPPSTPTLHHDLEVEAIRTLEEILT